MILVLEAVVRPFDYYELLHAMHAFYEVLRLREGDCCVLFPVDNQRGAADLGSDRFHVVARFVFVDAVGPSRAEDVQIAQLYPLVDPLLAQALVPELFPVEDSAFECEGGKAPLGGRYQARHPAEAGAGKAYLWT